MKKSKLLTSFIVLTLVISFSDAALAKKKKRTTTTTPVTTTPVTTEPVTTEPVTTQPVTTDPVTTTPIPTPTPEPTPAPTTTDRYVAPLWEAAVADGKLWTAHVERELQILGINLLDVIPADHADFCPTYTNMSYKERINFWTYFISLIAKYESSFRTGTAYSEGFTDSTGDTVVSRGLLQISFESGNAYGCNFLTTADLHDPYQNLSCGIRILDRWVTRDVRMAGYVDLRWRGGARYWHVLRTSSGSYPSIVAATKNLILCK